MKISKEQTLSLIGDLKFRDDPEDKFPENPDIGTVGCYWWERDGPSDLFVVVGTQTKDLTKGNREGLDVIVIFPRLRVVNDEILWGVDKTLEPASLFRFDCNCYNGQGFDGHICQKSVDTKRYYKNLFIEVDDDYQYQQYVLKQYPDTWYCHIGVVRMDERIEGFIDYCETVMGLSYTEVDMYSPVSGPEVEVYQTIEYFNNEGNTPLDQMERPETPTPHLLPSSSVDDELLPKNNVPIVKIYDWNSVKPDTINEETVKSMTGDDSFKIIIGPGNQGKSLLFGPPPQIISFADRVANELDEIDEEPPLVDLPPLVDPNPPTKPETKKGWFSWLGW